MVDAMSALVTGWGSRREVKKEVFPGIEEVLFLFQKQVVFILEHSSNPAFNLLETHFLVLHARRFMLLRLLRIHMSGYLHGS